MSFNPVRTASTYLNIGSGDAARVHVVTATASAEKTIALGPVEKISPLIESSETGGVVATGIVSHAPGAGVPLHVHRDEDEIFVILEGTYAVRLGEEEHTLTPGTVALLPKGVPHAFTVTGDVPGRFFAVVSPGEFGNFFRELQGMIAEAGPDADAAEVNALKGALATEYGLTFAMPGGPALPVTGDPARARIVKPEEGAYCWSMNHGLTFKLTGEETGGAFTLAVCDAPQGGNVPPHIHHVEDEFFYMLAGEVTAELGGQRVTLRAGDMALLPRGVAHTWINEAEATARFLVMTTPGGAFEGMIGEINALMNDPKMAHPSVLFPAIGETCARYNVEMLPPPAPVAVA